MFVIIKAKLRLRNEYYKFQLMSEYFNTLSNILFESFILKKIFADVLH